MKKYDIIVLNKHINNCYLINLNNGYYGIMVDGEKIIEVATLETCTIIDLYVDEVKVDDYIGGVTLAHRLCEE